MFFYYVRFKIDHRVEDNKFACKTDGLCTRKMGITEVFFLDQPSESGETDIEENSPKHRNSKSYTTVNDGTSLQDHGAYC